MNSDGANNLFPANGNGRPPGPSTEQQPAAPRSNVNFASDGAFQSQFDNAEDDAPVVNKIDNNQPQAPEIHWTAGEAPEHEHSVKWKMTLIAITIAIVLGLFALDIFNILPLVTSVTTGILAIIIMIAMFMVAKKPPRDIDYVLTERGITIDGQLHPFSEFRAYGVREIGALWELVLLPAKRFGIDHTAFIQEDQGEAIVDALGEHLPIEEVEDTLIDQISRAMKL